MKMNKLKASQTYFQPCSSYWKAHCLRCSVAFIDVQREL